MNPSQKAEVFHIKFIRRLLADRGFSEITITNSPPSEGDPNRLFYLPAFTQSIKRSLYLMSKAIEVISGRKILLGASLEVMAVKGVS